MISFERMISRKLLRMGSENAAFIRGVQMQLITLNVSCLANTIENLWESTEENITTKNISPPVEGKTFMDIFKEKMDPLLLKAFCDTFSTTKVWTGDTENKGLYNYWVTCCASNVTFVPSSIEVAVTTPIEMPSLMHNTEETFKITVPVLNSVSLMQAHESYEVVSVCNTDGEQVYIFHNQMYATVYYFSYNGFLFCQQCVQ